MSAVEAFRARIRRRAVALEVGGFRPPDSPSQSWFGRVNLALPGEGWPATDGRPMHALCQINLLDLPFRPPGLEDLAFLAVFLDPDALTGQTPNGRNWCLRSYPSLDPLVPLDAVTTGSKIKPFPMRSAVVDEDYPKWEDVAHDCPPEVDEDYSDLFENVPGIKLGGWPTLIQSEICWAPWNRHPASPRYVFQIDSVPQCDWFWGDAGVGYFGRGTAPGHEDEWAFEWQCL